MRILQIIESAAAGSGHQVLLSSRELAARGVELAIVYSDARSDVRFLTALDNIVGEFPETQVRMVRMRRSPHPSDLLAILALRRFVRDAGPFDVIHSHCTKAGFLARMAFPLSRRLHAYSPHAFFSMSPLHCRPVRSLILLYEKLMSALTGTVIAVSAEEYDHALTIGIRPEKVVLVANGIDLAALNCHDWATERAKYRGELKLRCNTVCVGFLGRLVPQKDLATLLRAFAAVRKRAPQEVVLVIAGKGPDEPMLRRLARDIGIDQSVVWAGSVDGPNIAAAFDIFALSSLYEGLPNCLLEAMALRRPCVVTNTGGARDLVRPGVNGFVAPVADPESLADALLTLAADAALREQFGYASAEIVAQFDIARTTSVMQETLTVRHARASAPKVPRPRRPLRDTEFGPRAPLRILQFVESSATGVGRHVVDLTQQLLDWGHDVHVIHSATNIDARFTAGLSRLAPRCKTTAMAMHHSVHIADAALILRLRTYLREEGPFDAIHCHSTKAGLIGRLAALGAGVPSIYTPHALFTMNPGISPILRRVAEAVEFTLARYSARVIAVSMDEYDHARRIGIPATRLSMVPNGIRAPRPRPEPVRRAPRAERSPVRIGFIGRLVPQKAVDHLLSAFAVMKASPQGGALPLLIIAGDGPLGDSLRAHAHALGLDDSVVWLGYVNGEELLSQLDVLAIPSDYEGFSYVALEGMNAGLPLVSTNVGGAPELVHTGINGYVVPRRDVHALASALTNLVADPELRAQMGAASHIMVQRFSIDRMANEIVGVYRTTVDERAGRQPSRSYAYRERLGRIAR
jgi:glycosyltransferase involved in cell wall biosynthesis